jgi:hypothetical protein
MKKKGNSRLSLLSYIFELFSALQIIFWLCWKCQWTVSELAALQKFIKVSEHNKPEKIEQQILKLPLPASDETPQTIRICMSD